MIAHPPPKSKAYLLQQVANLYTVGNMYIVAPALAQIWQEQKKVPKLQKSPRLPQTSPKSADIRQISSTRENTEITTLRKQLHLLVACLIFPSDTRKEERLRHFIRRSDTRMGAKAIHRLIRQRTQKITPVPTGCDSI